MPPMRTIPPAKAVKTERTHEENQERAYIAASRRSDRSLEARVESARRASEIHKRRTGRSLRVTEQDVINEEMYEEEDDDLPLQYRRLTAHLQTGSADFNRRLAAYLTNQVAMRSAMEHMSGSGYPQQYPGNPQYPQTSSTMFQSPMLPQHGMSHSPMSSYRAAPYPSPHHPNFRNMHSRAYSTATVPQMGQQPPTPSASSQSLNQRRMSTPSTVHITSQQVDTDNVKADPDYVRQTQSATLANSHFPPFYQDMHPFTTTLPHEAQQMLGPAFDSSDPFQSMMMHGSDNYTNSPYYPWTDMSNSVNGMPVHPSAYKGMSATLAPAALVSTPEAVSSATTPNTTSGPRTNSADLTAPSSGFDFSMSQEAKGLNIPNFDMSREHSLQGLTSGQVTPGGEGFWNDLVHDGGWSEEVVGQ